MLGPKSLLSKTDIPARYVLVVLLFLGQFVTSFVMTNLSLAIVAMVKPPEDNCTLNGELWCENATDIEGVCPGNEIGNGTAQIVNEGSYTWSTTVQGAVLGAYFYGVASVQLIAGRASDKFNLRWFVGICLLLGGTFTALVPMAAEVGYPLLIATRILSGMTQNVLYICVSPLLVRWIPHTERNVMYCIVICGFGLGLLSGPLMVGFLSQQTFAGGWPAVFYIVGAIGITWSFSWMLLVSDKPSTHPRISIAEKNYIMSGTPSDQGPKHKEQTTPWKSIFTSVRVWSFIFCFSCSSWILFSRLTLLPNYMAQVLHFPISENGEINSLVNGVYMVCTFASGYIADKILAKKWLSKTNTRKLMECIGLGGAGICLLAVIYSGCNATLVIVFLTLSSGFHGFTNSGDNVLAMDLAPAFPGTLFGIANTFATTTGFLSPLLTGLILDSATLSLNEKWNIVFYISAFIGLVGAAGGVFFFSAEVQPWDPTYNEANTKNDHKSYQMESGKPSHSEDSKEDQKSIGSENEKSWTKIEAKKRQKEKY